MDQLSVLEEENRRLRKAIDELSLLNELGRVISSTMGLDSVIENVVKRSVRAVHGQQGTITLVDEVQPTSMRTLIRTLDSASEHEQLHLNQNILGWMMINKKPLLSNDFTHDTRFTGLKVEGDIRSLLCVPLLVKNKLIGILTVFNKKENSEFTDDDTRLLAIIGTQSAQVLENARLYEQEQKKLAMEKDLVAAREVQMNLLPKQLPTVPHFELAATTIPALEVGGDFYDVIRLDGNACEVVIADVAGKGLPASLLATLAKGVVCAQAMQQPSPKLQLERSNVLLRGSVPRKSFITMLLAFIDPDRRTVTVANAGHCFPVLFRAGSGTVEPLPVRGMAVNVSDALVCEERVVPLDPGDCLLLYSDGVTEAMDLQQELFEVERLSGVVEKYAGTLSASALLQRIVDEIRRFASGAAQSDDITLFVVRAT
jgi:sigma-B regulation protein RsbU (phosphoserine phosphatase)